MIDIENYKRAIAWLRRSLNEHQQDPSNYALQLGILHRFEVTHNISEALLREAYIGLGVDAQAPYVSIRALISRAREEGFILSSPMHWLRYALLLESTKLAWLENATVNLDPVLPVLAHYAAELESFAESLQKRTAALA